MLRHRPTPLNVLVFSLVFAALLYGMPGILSMETLALSQYAVGLLTGVWSLWVADVALDAFVCWRKRRAARRGTPSDLE